MAHSVRPVVTLVLRLWRDPGDPEGDADWCGLVRPLRDADEAGTHLHGLDNFTLTLRQPLAQDDALISLQGAPTGSTCGKESGR